MKIQETIARSVSPHKPLALLLSNAVLFALLLTVAVPHGAAQCKVQNLKDASEFEKKSLVIDVRLDEINQFRGKSTFKDQASIVLVKHEPLSLQL